MSFERWKMCKGLWKGRTMLQKRMERLPHCHEESCNTQLSHMCQISKIPRKKTKTSLQTKTKTKTKTIFPSSTCGEQENQLLAQMSFERWKMFKGLWKGRTMLQKRMERLPHCHEESCNTQLSHMCQISKIPLQTKTKTIFPSSICGEQENQLLA